MEIGSCKLPPGFSPPFPVMVKIEKPEFLPQRYSKCLLTPNITELGRIAKAFGVALEGPMGSQWQVHAKEIARAIAGPILMSKGLANVVTDGHECWSCQVAATPKRSAGQGDVLAGELGGGQEALLYCTRGFLIILYASKVN